VIINSFSEFKVTGNSFRNKIDIFFNRKRFGWPIAGDPILINNDENNVYNSNENNDRDNNRNGYQKSQPLNKKRKVFRIKDTGATCDNRNRALIIKNGIERPLFIIGDEFKDINEAPYYRIFKGFKNNRLENKADNQYNKSLFFYIS